MEEPNDAIFRPLVHEKQFFVIVTSSQMKKIKNRKYLDDALVVELVLIVPHVISLALLLDHGLILVDANGALSERLAGLMTDSG